MIWNTLCASVELITVRSIDEAMPRIKHYTVRVSTLAMKDLAIDLNGEVDMSSVSQVFLCRLANRIREDYLNGDGSIGICVRNILICD